MRFLRRSRSSGDIPASAPAFPANLVRKLVSKRKSKALAVSSATIGLSIGSAFSNGRSASVDGNPGRGRDSGWQTAYAAAKIAIEIAKESSDVCPPLKAVTGAICVLIQNCDRAVDNAEAVKDIEERIHSLSTVLAAPVSNDDWAEKARRVELQRKLERVLTKLEPLSDQHVFLKFLRNVDNAKALTGFVQDLANAVTDYQLSIQQGVYERAREIHEGTRNIHEETQNIHETTRNVHENTQNIHENTQNIRETTKNIHETTQNIHEKTQNIHEVARSIHKVTRNIREDAKITHDVTKIIHEDARNILEISEVEILRQLEPVPNASYQSGHHEKCLPGTRESVLRDILRWAKSPQGQNVYWLNGVAGSGKSTIAQSIAGALADDGLLGASFFCSRDYLDRRELKRIFPTLAHQLACHYPYFRHRVITAIKKNPTIGHSSLITQLENLLVKPFSGGDVMCVIVIDALDECIDVEPASAILSVLGQFVKALPFVKFFITGRPEPRIRSGFRLHLPGPLTQIFLLHEVKSIDVNKDIQLYLTQRFTTIAQGRSDVDLPNPWPSEEDIDNLTAKSSGLFIFAATIVRFVQSDHHEPNERLKLILSKTSGTDHEGRTGIDSLYTQILDHAFSDVREFTVFTNIERVLGFIVLAFSPLSRRELSTVLGASTSLVSATLRHLHSVILVPTDETEKIRVFHKSFPDFLQDRGRCTDPRFYIDSMVCHGEIGLSCLKLVKKLKKNPCSLPPFTMNQDIQNLSQLLENKLGSGVRYACSHWARHLKSSRLLGSQGVRHLTTAVLKSSAPWIEVMSLENRLGEVIHSMNGLLLWLPHSLVNPVFEELTQLATDNLRMAMYFFYPIQQSAQQIYRTAFPLLPRSSTLYRLNQQGIPHGSTHVSGFLGAPSNWGSLLTTISVRPRQPTAIATFAEKIAIGCEDAVNIYDAVTFALEQSLPIPQSFTRIHGSKDGSILYLTHSRSVALWDIQTGGLIDTFHTRSKINDTAVSQTDGHIACRLSDGSVVFRDGRTGNEDSFQGVRPVVTICWLFSAELAVATTNSIYVININTGITSGGEEVLDSVWGMVVLSSNELMVGTFEPDGAEDHEAIASSFTTHKRPTRSRSKYIEEPFRYAGQQTPTFHGQLGSPIHVGNKITCITPPNGVQVFDTGNRRWTRPPLLEKAKSLATSLDRNLVVQTEDSVQIFSSEVLAGKAASREGPLLSQMYPLGEKHAVCLSIDRRLAIIELETLQNLHPNVDTSSLESLLTNSSASTSCGRGLVADFGVSMVVQAWKSLASLPRWTEDAEGDAVLGGSSPMGTRIATLYGLPRRELRVKEAADGTTVAKLPLEDDGSVGMGVPYDLTFDSETRVHLKVDGPGYHHKTPYNIMPSPSGRYPHTITQGEPVPLSQPRIPPPYTLDTNFEWVLDGQSRKICWIPPDIMQRGNGGHFWVGTSLVMLGSDSVVRKLTFKDPDG